jgi:hypothetical protein
MANTLVRLYMALSVGWVGIVFFMILGKGLKGNYLKFHRFKKFSGQLKEIFLVQKASHKQLARNLRFNLYANYFNRLR